MPKHDLYVEYLTDLNRTELRMMAKQQGVRNSDHMDRPELILALLDKKVELAERFVVTQARAWYANPNPIDLQVLRAGIHDLESLHDARNLWLKPTDGA